MISKTDKIRNIFFQPQFLYAYFDISALAVTYNKKAKLEAVKELLRFVPSDRFLCETDAPYLAPVPLRGTVNTPVNVEHVYNLIAEVRGMSPEELSNLVDENIKNILLGDGKDIWYLK